MRLCLNFFSQQFINTYQNVKLLPAFCKVDLSVYDIGIANVDECEILKHESYVWDARGTRFSKRVPETKSIYLFMYAHGIGHRGKGGKSRTMNPCL